MGGLGAAHVQVVPDEGESVGDWVYLEAYVVAPDPEGEASAGLTVTYEGESAGDSECEFGEDGSITCAFEGYVRIGAVINYSTSFSLIAGTSEIGEMGENFEADFLINANAFLSEPEVKPVTFTNSAAIDTLQIDFEGFAPAEIGFFASADGDFDPGVDVELSRFELSNSNIESSEFLVDLTPTENGQRLRLNPVDPEGASLQAALENEDVAFILAVAHPDAADAADVPFRGFYREDGSLAVLRTGPDSKDIVTINAGSLEFTARTAQNQLITSKSTPRGDINQLLVMTSELNDIVDVKANNGVNMVVKAGSGDDEIDSGGGDDVLDGGVGSDTYWFRAVAGGNDEIREEGDGDLDRLDFSSFTDVDGVSIALDHDKEQQVASNLRLTLKSPTLLENVTGGDHDDFIRGNDKVNRLIGLKGNDILVGLGGGSSGAGQGDTLTGNEGFDILLGDGFKLGGDVTLTPSDWNTLYADFAKFVKGEGEGEGVQFTLGLSLELKSSGSGGDTIDGGADDDVIIGGDGNDTITAGAGQALIFGDSFGVQAQFNLEFSASFSDLSKVTSLVTANASFSHQGNGIDTITSGTENSLIIGGDGDDIITGGNGGIEILLGNKGNDTIDGKNGLNVIIGGEGGEKLLRGGNGVNFILGDWIAFKSGSSPEGLSVGSSVTDLKPLADLIFGLEFAGTEGDTIEGGSGPNFIFGGGGNDTITGGNGSFDLLLGNAGNDAIKGQNGVNFIFGGNGSDDELRGGDDFNLIAAGELKFKPFDALAVTGETTFLRLVSFIKELFSAFSLESGAGDIDTMYGGAGPNLIFGGLGQDTIVGGDNQNSIDALFGFENADNIEGKAGFNLIVGGEGNDPNLTGGHDGNVIIGDHLVVEGFSINFDVLLSGQILRAFDTPKFEVTGSGNDVIFGGNGFDFLVGGEGIDDIHGGDGLNIAFGDTIKLQFGGAIGVVQNFASIASTIASASVLPDPFDVYEEVLDLIEEFGDVWAELFGDTSGLIDSYWGGYDTDIVFGGGGDDALRGGKGTDFLVGGLGDDWFLVEPECEDPEPSCWVEDGFFKDIAFGGEGDDEFHGGPGPDFLASTDGNDKFFGDGGDDVIFGGAGDDELQGGDGDDTLVGEAGSDFIDGGAGADRIYAGPGDDTIISDPDDQVDDPADRLPGDTNLDGHVDLVDLNNVRNNFGALGAGVLGDANDDGRVDLQDLNAVRNNFGASAPGSPPERRAEPTTAVHREHSLLERSRESLAARPTSSRIDDLVFGADNRLGESPFAVVSNRLPGLNRGKSQARLAWKV